MGSQQCSTCEQKKTQSSAYGSFDILLENSCQYAIISKSIVKNTIDVHTLDRQLSKRSNISSVYVVRLYSYRITIDNFFINVELKYEYIPLTLGQKYAQWKNTDKRISESEIGNVLSGVENALLDLNRNGITHRFVNFNTILCIKAMYKLVDTSMITFLTGLDLARGGDEHQLLSEKNLNILNLKGTKPDYNIEDDLFSLGLVVIVIVLKCSPKDLYQHNTFGERRHNMAKIQAGLQIIDEVYDAWIGKKVRELLWGSLKSSNATCNLETACKRQVCYD